MLNLCVSRLLPPQILNASLLSSPLLFKPKHLFPPCFCFHIAHQTLASKEWREGRKESEEIENTWTQMWNSCALFFHSLQQILRNQRIMSSNECQGREKAYFSVFSFSRPGGYTRILEALCKHNHT